MHPDTACSAPQDAPELHVLSLVSSLCSTALEGVPASSCIENSLHQSPYVQETPCPQSAFREELDSQHDKALASLLISFDNCNFILIIYGQASEFSGSDPGHVFHVVGSM